MRVGERCELLLTVHHVVLDGWAIQLLMAELSVAYEGGEFDGEPVPFTVYAAEQHEARAAGQWDKTLEYWRDYLEGATATTVAADRPGRFGVGAPGVVIRHMLSAQASTGVAALAKASFATPFAIMLAALEIVLARTAGNDISIGVVAANRMSVRDQALMGYTANLCVVRVSIEDSDTVAQVVARSRDGLWQMLAHQGVPYPAVFGGLSTATQASLTDASPMLVSYLGPIGFDLKLGDVGLTWLASPNRAARADMAMSFAEVDGGHRAELEYNTGRYDHSTVIQLLEDVDAVLAIGGAEPSSLVGSLPIRTRATTGRADEEVVERQALPEGPEWDVIAEEWSALVETPPANPDADFFASGGHSLHVVRLLAAVRDRVGSPVDIADWLVDPTPRRLVAQLNSTGDDIAPSTLVTLREGPGTHLHLIHGAGGGVQDYRDLVKALPADWRITVSQEVEPLATVPMMARAYRTDLADLRPDILAGWSMGGQIAFEMARHAEPRLLAVIDSTPPIGQDYPDDIEREWFQIFGRNLMASFGVTGEFGDTLVIAAHLARAGHHVPAHVLTDRWEVFLRHAQASTAYAARGPLAQKSVVVAADLLDSQLDQWAGLVHASKHRIAADHYGVLRGEAAQRLAAILVDAAVQ